MARSPLNKSGVSAFRGARPVLIRREVGNSLCHGSKVVDQLKRVQLEAALKISLIQAPAVDAMPAKGPTRERHPGGAHKAALSTLP